VQFVLNVAAAPAPAVSQSVGSSGVDVVFGSSWLPESVFVRVRAVAVSVGVGGVSGWVCAAGIGVVGRRCSGGEAGGGENQCTRTDASGATIDIETNAPIYHKCSCSNSRGAWLAGEPD